MSTKLDYLWIKPRANGSKVAYYRRGKIVARVTAPDGRNLLPSDAGFLEAFSRLASIHRETAPAVKSPAMVRHSIADLAARYQDSDAWRALAPQTQHTRRRLLALLVERHGYKSAALMPRPAVLDVRDEFAKNEDGEPTPSTANKMMAVLRILLQIAVDRGWREHNPALNVPMLYTGDGHKTWTHAQFRKLMDCKKVGEPVKRAVALAYYTGLRAADLIVLPKSARRDGNIETVPQKTRRSTGAVVAVMEHPALTSILDAAPGTDAPTVLTSASGRPWTYDALAHALQDAVVAAGLPAGLTLHGLRNATVATLAEAGATDAEIEAVVPHASPKLTKYYRRHAEQRVLAAAAMAKLMERKPA